MKQDLKIHFEKLAAKHRVRVFSYVRDRGEAPAPLQSLSVKEHREIYLTPLRSEASYAVAMHELGHILGPYQTPYRSVLEQEAGAWQWAKENALRWSPTMQRAMYDGMLSYFEYAWNSGHSFPKPSHFFWQCLPKGLREFVLPREVALVRKKRNVRHQ